MKRDAVSELERESVWSETARKKREREKERDVKKHTHTHTYGAGRERVWGDEKEIQLWFFCAVSWDS